MSNEFDGVRASYPDITTRAELRQRLRDSARPSPEPRLEPSDALMESIRKDSFESHTERIKELRQSLGAAREGFETDFALKPKHGMARADFGRSR